MAMEETWPFTAWLTIDDAPSMDTTCKLDTLAARAIKATWFCRGEYLEQLPDVAVAMIKRGHVIGNHSWNHPRFSGMRLSKIKQQIQRTEVQIDLAYSRAGIYRPIKVFRFPWGDKGAGTHLDRGLPIDAAEHVHGIQVLLRDLGFEQLVFPGVELPCYPGYDLAADADTWFTFDAMEWALMSQKHNHGIENLDAVLARIDTYFREKRANILARGKGEIIIIHDFETTRGTFIPILDRLATNGALFLPPRIHRFLLDESTKKV